VQAMEARRHDGADRATNEAVGRRLGISYSGVSRIRSGQRYPSLANMRKIRDVYGWALEDQLALVPNTGKDMRYADELERRIAGRGEEQ